MFCCEILKSTFFYRTPQVTASAFCNILRIATFWLLRIFRKLAILLSFFSEVEGLRPASLLAKGPYPKCCPKNLEEFYKAPPGEYFCENDNFKSEAATGEVNFLEFSRAPLDDYFCGVLWLIIREIYKENIFSRSLWESRQMFLFWYLINYVDVLILVFKRKALKSVKFL